MNNEADFVHHEINRYVLLLRSESDVEKKQRYLDEINRLNAEYKRLYDTDSGLRTQN